MEFFFLLGFLAITLSIVFSSLFYGISPMPTNRKTQKKLVQILEKISPKKLVDLGSGWGSLCLEIAKKCPKTSVTGYEASFFPWLVSLLFRSESRRFFWKNFFKEPLEEYDVIVCYLYPGAMKKLRDKLEKECKKDTVIVSNTFQIPGWTPSKIIPTHDFYGSFIYVYVR